MMAEAPMEVIDREKKAFERMKPGLIGNPEYRGRYVAVLDGQLIDSDPSMIELAKRVYRTHGYRPIYVGLVTDKPDSVHVIKASACQA